MAIVLFVTAVLVLVVTTSPLDHDDERLLSSKEVVEVACETPVIGLLR